jgi:hypothetical protein
VAFPKIESFSKTNPGPYERQMGRYIMGLLDLFTGRVPDTESHSHVRHLAANPNYWSAGHAVFDEIRRLYLTAVDRKNNLCSSQYAFEESCCQAIYNATDPVDPFDASSAFFVVPQALGLVTAIGASLDEIAHVFRTSG